MKRNRCSVLRRPPKSGKGARVFVGLGSNVQNRPRYLRSAVAALRGTPGFRVVRLSPVYETSPVGPRQKNFLNAVIEIHTRLSPEALLKGMKSLERKTGRRRRKRWGPREIDLDLLLYGSLQKETKSLEVPHPRFRERKFVLRPLADLAAGFRDPVSGKTVARLLDELTDSSQRIKLYRTKSFWNGTVF